MPLILGKIILNLPIDIRHIYKDLAFYSSSYSYFALFDRILILFLKHVL